MTAFSATANGNYSLTPIGNLPGQTTVFGDTTSLNNRGQVIGQMTDDSGGHYFLWNPTSPNSASGTTFDFAALTARTGLNPYFINDHGQVAGQFYDSNSGGSHTFLWAPNGGSGVVSDVGAFRVGFESPSHLNELGQISGTNHASGIVVTLWTPAVPNGTTGGFVDIGQLPGKQFAYSIAMNDRGQIIGKSMGDRNTNEEMFLWTPSVPNGTAGNMVVIPPPRPTDEIAWPWAINNLGQVVGEGGGYNDPATRKAFLWTPNTPNGSAGTTMLLPVLPGFTGEIIPYDINDAGQIAGAAGTDSGGFHAVLWTKAGMVDLNTLIDAPGWELNFAEGINEAGQIVGRGDYDPDGPGGVDPVSVAFLLTPNNVPEPAGISLILAMIMPMVRRRRVIPASTAL